jgi:hypothetical protein
VPPTFNGWFTRISYGFSRPSTPSRYVPDASNRRGAPRCGPVVQKRATILSSCSEKGGRSFVSNSAPDANSSYCVRTLAKPSPCVTIAAPR